MKPTRAQIAQAMRAAAPPAWEEPEWAAKAADAKPRKTYKREEEKLQKLCVQYLETLKDCLYFSVPNHLFISAKSTKAAAYINKQKTLGLTPGVSDLVIVLKAPEGPPRILFCELKSPKGVLSENQDAFLRKASWLGCHAAVIRSMDDMIAAVKCALK